MAQSGPATATSKLDIESWAALPEDVSGELVNGRLVEGELPTYVHEIVVGFLVVLLRNWLIPRGGFVGVSGAKFAVSASRGRKPDLSAYFPGSKLPDPHAAVSKTPPDIMIEVVSPSPSDARRDRVDKLTEYAAFGVRYYWIVDPALRSVEILELSANGRYLHAASATSGSMNEIPGCPDLLLNVDALWEEMDRFVAATESSSNT